MAKKFVNLIFKGNQKIQYWFIKVQEQQPVFYKRLFFEIFPKFTGKHLCQSVFFNKVAGLRPATSLKRDSGKIVFL